jgi:hypothetical protein
MAPDSKTAKSPASRSTMTGMRPFGFSARNHGSRCSSAARFTTRTEYGSPSSSSAMETLCPLGVAAVYRSIIARLVAWRAAPQRGGWSLPSTSRKCWVLRRSTGGGNRTWTSRAKSTSACA